MQNTQYTDAPAEVYEDEEAVLEALDPGDIDSEERTISPEDQEFADMIAARRIAIKKKRMRRKRRSIVLMILVFALLFTMCSREIIRLKAENYALRQENARLEKERDRLTKELEHVSDKDYIKNQARKQLRLLDPGEIMFIFEDGDEQPDEEETEEQADNGEKDGGSNG